MHKITTRTQVDMKQKQAYQHKADERRKETKRGKEKVNQSPIPGKGTNIGSFLPVKKAEFGDDSSSLRPAFVDE
jgi:hypothetical protein